MLQRDERVHKLEPGCAADASVQILRELHSCDNWSSQSLILQQAVWLGSGAILCWGTLCVSVSVASAAQSQVKYPPPTVQSVRGSCPPRPLSLWLTAPPSLLRATLSTHNVENIRHNQDLLGPKAPVFLHVSAALTRQSPFFSSERLWCSHGFCQHYWDVQGFLWLKLSHESDGKR